MAARPLNPPVPSDPPASLPLDGFRRHLRMTRARLSGREPNPGQAAPPAALPPRCSPFGCRFYRLPGQATCGEGPPALWPTKGGSDPDPGR